MATLRKWHVQVGGSQFEVESLNKLLKSKRKVKALRRVQIGKLKTKVLAMRNLTAHALSTVHHAEQSL